jgi:hypothetical protein
MVFARVGLLGGAMSRPKVKRILSRPSRWMTFLTVDPTYGAIGQKCKRFHVAT